MFVDKKRKRGLLLAELWPRKKARIDARTSEGLRDWKALSLALDGKLNDLQDRR